MIQDTSAQDTKLAQKSPWLKRIKWILAGIAVVSAVAVAYPSYQSWQDIDVSVQGSKLRMAKVTRGAFVRDISATGKIVAAHAPSVYSTVSGNIHLVVQPGDLVKIEQVVARLSSPQLTNQLKQQQSVYEGLTIALERQKLNVRSAALKVQQTLDMADVTLKAAKREQRRAKISIADQLISQIDFEKSEDDLSVAQLSYDHASQEAALKKDQLAFEIKTAELDVNRQKLVVDDLHRQVAELNIKAPLDGVVGNWLVEQRSQVRANQALLTVVDLTAYEAQLSMPENFADDIGLEMETEIMVNGALIKGRISAISPEVNNNQVTTRVRFDAQDTLGLRQNQRVTARVLLENKADVLMVKRGAFLQSGGGHFAYLVNQNTARKINIEVGASSISQIEMLSGVKEGDQLVISSLELFKQAKQVAIR
jgi:HlyD family secretion protein